LPLNLSPVDVPLIFEASSEHFIHHAVSEMVLLRYCLSATAMSIILCLSGCDGKPPIVRPAPPPRTDIEPPQPPTPTSRNADWAGLLPSTGAIYRGYLRRFAAEGCSCRHLQTPEFGPHFNGQRVSGCCLATRHIVISDRRHAQRQPTSCAVGAITRCVMA
jgi:hypothetical protein